MIKQTVISLIALITIIGCNLEKENHKIVINNDIALNSNSLMASSRTNHIESYPNGIMEILLKVGIANKVEDTIRINFWGGFMTGYTMKLNIYNDVAEIKFHEFSCTYSDDFIVDNQEVILDKSNYSVGENVNAFIKFSAYRNSKDPKQIRDTVYISGNFKVKLRDKDDDYEVLNYEHAIAELDTINVNTTKNLSIEFCNFKRLPTQIKKLKYLERLVASNNLIDSLDIDMLSKLKYLKCLELNNNLITEINQIDKLSNLEHLELQLTKIKKIPKGINKLRHLNYVNICNTEIYEIPVELINLRSLKTICLPDSFVNKEKIKKILRKRKIEFYE